MASTLLIFCIGIFCGKAYSGSVCSSTYFYGPTGTILSPNYPNNYSNGLHCSTYIVVKPGDTVVITFFAFDTQWHNDYVTISCYSGNDFASQQYSGERVPEVLTIKISSCKYVEMAFHTDSSLTRTGFSLAYGITQGCVNSYFSGPAGRISSPNYPNNYTNGLNSYSYIAVSSGHTIVIAFLAFNTQRYNDWIAITCASGIAFTPSSHSGSQLPASLTISSCSLVRVYFHTDKTTTDTGFILTYNITSVGSMIVTPRNTVVIAGEKVEMKCGVDRTSKINKWVVSKPGSADMLNISRITSDVDNTGVSTIYYNSTNLDDAGNYSCHANLGTDQQEKIYSAQLIVLESLPNCTSEYSSEITPSADLEVVYMIMQCTLRFRGFWFPTMQWTQHDGNEIVNRNGQEVRGEIESQITQIFHVTSSLNVSRNSLGKGTLFSCRTYFERTRDGTLITNATNIPDFSHVWTSSAFVDASSTFQEIEQKDIFQRRTVTYFLVAAVIGLGAVMFVAFVLVGYYRRKLHGVQSRPTEYEVNMTREDKTDDYETMQCAIAERYETIEEVTSQKVETI